MNYPASLALNFLAVLLLVQFAPGLASAYSATASFGADLLFAAVTAFFNASIFSCLVLLEIFPTKLKLGVLNGIISFGAFSLLAIIPYGLQPDPGGVAIGGALTWLVSFLLSYLEMRRWIDMHH